MIVQRAVLTAAVLFMICVPALAEAPADTPAAKTPPAHASGETPPTRPKTPDSRATARTAEDSTVDKFEFVPKELKFVFAPPDHMSLPKAFFIKSKTAFDANSVGIIVTQLSHASTQVRTDGVTFSIEGKGTFLPVAVQFDSAKLSLAGTYDGLLVVEDRVKTQLVPVSGQKFTVFRPEAKVHMDPTQVAPGESVKLVVLRYCPPCRILGFWYGRETFPVKLWSSGAFAKINEIFPAHLSSQEEGVTDGKVTTDLKKGLTLSPDKPVDLNLKVGGLPYAGKYNGKLTVVGEGLKEPAEITATVIVTDYWLWVALPIAIGVFLSYFRPKTDLDAHLNRQLSVLAFVVAVITVALAQQFTGDYFGTLKHYLTAFIAGYGLDKTAKLPRVRQFLKPDATVK